VLYAAVAKIEFVVAICKQANLQIGIVNEVQSRDFWVVKFACANNIV